MALTQKGVRGLLARGEVGRHFDRDGLYLIVNSSTRHHHSGQIDRRHSRQRRISTAASQARPPEG
jgi:hypothetical protein